MMSWWCNMPREQFQQRASEEARRMKAEGVPKMWKQSFFSRFERRHRYKERRVAADDREGKS